MQMWQPGGSAKSNLGHLLTPSDSFTGPNGQIQYVTINSVDRLIAPAPVQLNDYQVSVPIAAPAEQAGSIVPSDDHCAVGRRQDGCTLRLGRIDAIVQQIASSGVITIRQPVREKQTPAAWQRLTQPKMLLQFVLGFWPPTAVEVETAVIGLGRGRIWTSTIHGIVGCQKLYRGCNVY